VRVLINPPLESSYRIPFIETGITHPISNIIQTGMTDQTKTHLKWLTNGLSPHLNAGPKTKIVAIDTQPGSANKAHSNTCRNKLGK
jgi:hypothetical protein